MSEATPNYEQIAQDYTSKQIDVSVAHGLNNQSDPKYEGSARMHTLHKEAVNVPEKARRLIKEAAKFLGQSGIAPEVMTRSQRALTVASWGTRGERIVQHLENFNTSEARNDVVWRTLDELDPKYSVRMQEKDGSTRMQGMRRSVNLPPTEVPQFRDVAGNDQFTFPEAIGLPGYVVIEGNAFSRDAILATLDGHQEMRAMFDVEGYATLPIRNNKGELFCVRLDYGQVKKVEAGLRAQRKSEIASGKETSFDPEIVVSGGASMASPDHGLQDRYDNFIVKDQTGNPKSRREVVVDGSGGSLGKKGYDQSTQDRLIGEKAVAIMGGLRKHAQKDPKQALESASDEAANTTSDVNGRQVRNEAYGTALVCDFSEDGLHIANAGDVGLVLWRELPFRAHRSPSIFKNGTPHSSQFQLQNVLDNVGQAMKMSDDNYAPTKILDEVDTANHVYKVVGGDKVEVNNTHISIEEVAKEEPEFALIMSDGGRPGSNLLVEGDPYSVRVSDILVGLKQGKIPGTTQKERLNNAAMMIVQASRDINHDMDDITCRIIDIKDYVQWCQQKSTKKRH